MINTVKRLFGKKEQKIKREVNRMKDFTRVNKYMEKIDQKRTDYIGAGANQQIRLSNEL